MFNTQQSDGIPRSARYDLALAGGMAAYLAVFVGLGAWLQPNATAETLLIRALGTLAFLLLNVTLAIGPLTRLDARFLPLLYNRRHMGVATFLMALSHGTFALVQFHALADVNPLVSLLTSNTRWNTLAQFPFQLLGFGALLVLFVMAATSHDFWLHTLTPAVWKRIHMSVYGAYALLVGHIALGALQSETNPVLAAVLFVSIGAVTLLHLAAARREARAERIRGELVRDGFVDVGRWESIPEGRATVVSLGRERVAIFRHAGNVSAISNVCGHQNGPLGEGRIVNGCVTCPWHGYQYNPRTGASPPPFNDRVPVFETRLVDSRVLVHPRPMVKEASCQMTSI